MSNRDKEINNARITGTMLGTEDHGIFTCYLYLEWEGGGVGFGGYVLGGVDKAKNFGGPSIEFLNAILETVGVEKWEDLEGKYCRAVTRGVGSKCEGIGNILKDKWLYPEAFFEERRKAAGLES